MNTCDACNVTKAVYVVKKGTLELYFCNHHFTKHEAGLIGWSDSVETLDKTLAMV